MILVQLPTEPSYWGSSATKADVERIVKNLETLIRSEFSDAPFEIWFERTETPRGTGIHGDDDDACAAIFEFVQNNWTAAL